MVTDKMQSVYQYFMCISVCQSSRVILQFHPDPDDYTDGSISMLIPAQTVKVTLPVTTLTDNLKEDKEYFKATLSLPGALEDVVVASPDVAFVSITDNTCMWRILSACSSDKYSRQHFVLLLHTFIIPCSINPNNTEPIQLLCEGRSG